MIKKEWISRLTLQLFILLSTGFAALTMAADNTPIKIEADRMVSMEKENSVLFTGNVDAKQGDIRILSDEMTVFYEQTQDSKSQEVKKLLCIGNVEVTRGDWLGTGKTMNYFALERKVILSGGAKAWQGQNLVTGDTIIYWMDEGRSEVVGDRITTTVSQDENKPAKPTRVQATIIPKQ